ncbi:hypothetical protein FB451DRAFT_1400805 [Mycena latifolia]|nr:hypothetical protein FB451DRAFT_1400805 [Mycena latifolia]
MALRALRRHPAAHLLWPSKTGGIPGKWYESRMPVGAHPFRAVWTYQNWASPDDCDFLMHLSNSSYLKALDCARMRLAIKTFPIS